jgi:hypothetical protein
LAEYREYRRANTDWWGIEIVSKEFNYYLSDDIDPSVSVTPSDFDWLLGYGLTVDDNRYLIRQILRRKTLEKRQRQHEIIHNPVSYVFYGAVSLITLLMLYMTVTAIFQPRTSEVPTISKNA